MNDEFQTEKIVVVINNNDEQSSGMAVDCNTVHIPSGIPQFSLGSLRTGLSILLETWAASFLMFDLPMKKDPKK